MWDKQLAIYVHESRMIWESLLFLVKNMPVLPNPVFKPHLSETRHTASLDDFKIFCSCSSPSEVLVRESLIISKLKPSLNGNLSSIPLFSF